jgi:hypothetical protein
MNCMTHPEAPAVAFCRSCGRALCESCKRVSAGTIYCEEHAGAAAPPSAYAPPPYASHPADASASPGLALLLGFIPGVGAIYNGQYAKGLVHAIIFGLLVSILSSNAAGGLEPLFGILTGVWCFYMILEAYHTARKRRSGVNIDEFSSLVDMRGGSNRFPAGAVLLILLGGVLLLNTTDIIRLEHLIRYWPVLLILVGVYMLYTRISASRGPSDGPEASHGQQ